MIFDSLYLRFIQTYFNKGVETYLFGKTEGAMTRNFNFFCNECPVLSTTKKFEIAFDYASGAKCVESVKNSVFIPKVRRSTGHLKHRRVGFVRAYAFHTTYQIHIADIDTLRKDQKIKSF